MIREMKIQNDEIYPKGQWVFIANERDENKVIDKDIYFYVEDHIDLLKINVGKIIELDESFKIIGLV
jgi:hypothetical protein